MKTTTPVVVNPDFQRVLTDNSLSIIRVLSELLYRENNYSSLISVNRIGLDEEQQSIVKSKLIEHVNNL
jgi:hypothetical protein